MVFLSSFIATIYESTQFSTARPNSENATTKRGDGTSAEYKSYYVGATEVDIKREIEGKLSIIITITNPSVGRGVDSMEKRTTAQRKRC